MRQCEFDAKINQLKPYKVYGYSNFKNLDMNSFSNLVSRAEKKGLLVKIGKGLFYRRNKSEASREAVDSRRNNPSGRYELRQGAVRPERYPIVSELFWSNKHNSIPLENFISKIINEDCYCYFPFLQHKFGDRKVMEIYLKNFRSQGVKKEFFEDFFNV